MDKVEDFGSLEFGEWGSASSLVMKREEVRELKRNPRGHRVDSGWNELQTLVNLNGGQHEPHDYRLLSRGVNRQNFLILSILRNSKMKLIFFL